MILEDIAGWVAPAATMIAAMMTAANLGARFTGWGFVVFVAGSVAWSVVGLTTGQSNLLATNIVLALVNLVGVWRWLGRQATYQDGGEAAVEHSEAGNVSTLFRVSSVAGRPVKGRDGRVLAHAVDAMGRAGDGGICYIVVREGGMGGIGERLHTLAWGEFRITEDALETNLDADTLARRKAIDQDEWPVQPQT